MWLVRLALRRPYTFIVTAMLIVLLGTVTIARMATDILPEIDIPVISVVWTYSGFTAEEMDKRVITGYERFVTTTVNDIEHIESQSLAGVGVVKIFFHPGAKIEAATAQVTAISQLWVRLLPPGSTPPLIIRYSASNVPILQASLSSDTLTEQQIADLGSNFVRTGLATLRGAQVPSATGGKARLVSVDLDLDRLHALGLSPNDISNAISAGNLALPVGTAKIGEQEYGLVINSTAEAIEDLNQIPIKTSSGATVLIRDVAKVRDGFAPQTAMVRVDGKKGAVLPILKSSDASTLDVVSRVRERLPVVLSTLTRELKVTLLFDQSLFVRAAVNGVVREAGLAAVLTGLMIMLFLGSWRSTLIVVVSIPLSILVSIIVLYAIGQTLNTMTLGGMALAVGILVDDATVAIENIHRNFAEGKPLIRGIIDGTAQIAVPAFVSTLCICIVFVPVGFIAGAARSLFVPLALAVVFAMLTSYLLSRTLVPTLVMYLLKGEVAVAQAGSLEQDQRGWAGRFFAAFGRLFESVRSSYGRALAWTLTHRRSVAIAFFGFVACSVALAPFLGRDFFPTVDAGQMRLHVRARPGMRLEETARRFSDVEAVIREIVPPDEIDVVLDNIGVPANGVTLALSDPSLISSADGEILVSLKPHHHATEHYIHTLRRELRRRFPDLSFFFLAPDIATQVLNFGISAPIDVQITGPRANDAQNLAVAQRLREGISHIPGAVDVHLHQVLGAPALRLDVDRTLAHQVGLTQQSVAQDVGVSLASSSQVSPNWWLDTKLGVQYAVAVQTPQYRIDSMAAIRSTPMRATSAAEPELLGNVANLSRTSLRVNLNHYDVAPLFDVLANVEGVDLGTVSDAVDEIIARTRPQLPRGSQITVTGQVKSMNASFRGLGFGLLFAIVLVYLLMVVNFQSWVDPFIILGTLPGALAGILWMLFVSQTTLSVPALMGAIMSVGVATANSILVVTYANDQRRAGRTAHEAALDAGMTRLRPVVMTALAMIMGMLPMALGIGEGAEQNAPLGRAVIGGLLVATLTTLFLVPLAYTALCSRVPTKLAESQDLE
jgi:multidrug efflux pump subunit AcrB